MDLRTLLFASLLLLLPSSALALPANWTFDYDDQHGFDLSLLGEFDVDLSGAGSVVLGIPVAPFGFSVQHNDAFLIEVEVGGRAGFPKPGSIGYGEVFVLGGVRYQLYLLDWLAPYVAVRGGVSLGFTPGWRTPHPRFSGGLGTYFLVDPKVVIRLELGYPGIRGGVTFLF